MSKIEKNKYLLIQAVLAYWMVIFSKSLNYYLESSLIVI